MASRSERETGASLARPPAGPSEREEERGNDGRLDQWPLATGDNEKSRRRNASPTAICSPIISDHQCSSQKTSAEPSAAVVMKRASRPVSKATPATEATRNDP